LNFPNKLPQEAEIMRRKVYLVVLSVLCVTLLLVSCTSPVKKDIFINISLTGEAANINHSKFSTTPASFHDNIVVNKYKLYLYQNGTLVYQQESTSVSNNTISLHLTTINSGTYTLRVEAFNDTTPIFYGEKVVQLSYGQNNIQLTTYFNKAKLTVNVENQTNGFELTGLSIEGTLPATSTNNFVENKTFENKEIYPGVWHIDLEATMTSDSSSIKVTYPTRAYEIYPSEDKVLNFVIKRDDLGNVYIDLLTEVELPYLDKVWNMRAERNEDGLKLMWDYNLPATFNIYRRDGDEIEFIGSTTAKYFVDTNPVSSKNHYYVNAMYGGKESGLCELVIDLQPPQITIVSPTDGETLHGTVTILAEVQDNEGIAQVEFFANDTLLKSFTSSPYEYAWNTYGVIDGTYTLKVQATDLLGNQNSKSINVIVSNGQNTFEKTFGGNSEDWAFSIHQTTDRGYIVAGFTSSLGAGFSDAYVLKIDSNGKSEWQQTFGGNYYDYASSIHQTTDDGYIVAGYTWSFGAGGYDVYILKLNSNGALIWQKTFGGGLDDKAYSIQQTTDGGYIVAGETYSSGAGGCDIYVLKLNSNGTLIWQKTFGENGDDRAYSIQQTTDGGYIVAGETYSSGADGCDIYVLKLNPDGEMVWQQTFGGNGDDAALSIQQTADDGYIVAGYTSVLLADGFDVSNAYILKLGSSGNPAWQKVLGGEYSSYAYSAQQTTDGGYIVGGATTSFAGDGDVYVLKLNSDGEMVWQKTFGESGDDAAYSIQQTTDSGYIVAGHTNSFGAGSYDVYILKLNSSGELQQ